MEIGIGLPQMATGYGSTTTVDWARLADQAVGRPFEGRHARSDRQVGELKDLLAGQPPFEGAEPVGPALTRQPGPEILAGALGPKSMARAAQWADGALGVDDPLTTLRAYCSRYLGFLGPELADAMAGETTAASAAAELVAARGAAR